MISTYVLYSPNYDKIYIGFTTNLEARFKTHNELGKKGYTLKFRPWVLLLYEKFSTKKEAIQREKQLKSHAGRDYIWKIVREKYPLKET